MAPMSFALHIVAKLLCFCLRVLDAIIELHAMNEKKSSMTFSSESEHAFYL